MVLTSEVVWGEGTLEEGQSPEDKAGHPHGECYQATGGQHWDQEEEQDNWKKIVDAAVISLCFTYHNPVVSI